MALTASSKPAARKLLPSDSHTHELLQQMQELRQQFSNTNLFDHGLNSNTMNT
jgi:hypothetical protein